MNINFRCWRDVKWGEEGKRWFEFPKSVCQNFSLALNVGKKLLELKFSGMRPALWQVVVAVAFRKNFK